MAVSPDGTLAAFTVREPESEGVSIRLWNIRQNEEVASLSGHADTVVSLRFSPDGALIVSHGMDDALQIWGVP